MRHLIPTYSSFEPDFNPNAEKVVEPSLSGLLTLLSTSRENDGSESMCIALLDDFVLNWEHGAAGLLPELDHWLAALVNNMPPGVHVYRRTLFSKLLEEIRLCQRSARDYLRYRQWDKEGR
jgi:hypothetical protein